MTRSAPARIATMLSRPGIALLPLETGNDVAATRLLARGLTADPSNLFARCCWFPVIDPTALLAVTPTDSDGDCSARAVAKRLGARFLVQGLLRSSRDGFLLVVRVDEADSGRCLWTGRFSATFGTTTDGVARVAQALAALG